MTLNKEFYSKTRHYFSRAKLISNQHRPQYYQLTLHFIHTQRILSNLFSSKLSNQSSHQNNFQLPQVMQMNVSLLEWHLKFHINSLHQTIRKGVRFRSARKSFDSPCKIWHEMFRLKSWVRCFQSNWWAPYELLVKRWALD